MQWERGLYESGVAPNAALPNVLENTVCENRAALEFFVSTLVEIGTE
jgi:hypothetical protein